MLKLSVFIIALLAISVYGSAIKKDPKINWSPVKAGSIGSNCGKNYLSLILVKCF